MTCQFEHISHLGKTPTRHIFIKAQLEQLPLKALSLFLCTLSYDQIKYFAFKLPKIQSTLIFSYKSLTSEFCSPGLSTRCN